MCRDRDQEASDPACQIVELLPNLDTILRRLRGSYGNLPWRQQQMEDHFQNILLLLIEDDYRRLRSHDQRCSLNAWLKTIAKHYLADCFRGQIQTEDSSKVSSGTLIEAKQEDEMIYQEQVGQLREAFGLLSDRERLLCESLLSDLETEEIALALGIEPHQVRKRRYELIKKIRKRLAEGGESAGKK